MWPRVVEVMLACWLACSPFILRYSAEQKLLWWNDYICFFLILTFSLISFYRKLNRAYLLNLLVAAWLFGIGWVTARNGSPPFSQNYICLGILILLFAIIPMDTNMPPPEWQDYYKRHPEEVRGQNGESNA